MRKFLSLLFLALLVSCSSPKPQPTIPQLTIAQQIENSSVALVFRVKDRALPFCSGIWISDSAILTANHCVQYYSEPDGWDEEKSGRWNAVGSEIAYVVRSDVDTNMECKVARYGKVVANNYEQDLALVKSNVKNIPFHGVSKVSTKQLIVGNPVHVVGSPVGFWFTYSAGYIGFEKRIMDTPRGNQTKVIQISAPIYSGNSGGGVFDSTGDIIGVASFVNTKAMFLTFFVHRDSILEFVEKNKKFL
jgi:hypothetical protein